ncbi:hypothetical protein AGLY_016060 [Aphis glycines]|uniref:DUF7869 domain-containing protein n=1 Tax=Aphis glycines TaxID=307491 RepID=A0A6G0SZC8_APHGL|nr:hypothetical protein AGLY_016060 [Aphis glycines]
MYDSDKDPEYLPINCDDSVQNETNSLTPDDIFSTLIVTPNTLVVENTLVPSVKQKRRQLINKDNLTRKRSNNSSEWIGVKSKRKLNLGEELINRGAVFDLQKVLTTPQGDVGSFYYKRKFATYNFTVYDIGKKQAYSYMWCESDGKRGSNEIGTCLLKFIKFMKENYGISEFSFYSDNCAGQNRNRYIYSMWEYAAFIHKVNIRHTFLEKGHTQNEGDSAHATIECAKKETVIDIPMQWVTLVQSA